MKAINTSGLSIAGLGVEIEINDTDILAILSDRYSAFKPGSPTCCRVNIQVQVTDQPPGFLFTQPVFHPQSIEFRSQQYEGKIDLDAELAEIRIASRRPEIDIDYFLRVVYAGLVFRAGGLLFHAAAIQRWEKGFVFFGHSGSGKTTVARCSPPGSVLNDDLVVLLPEGNQWLVYGTPFWNPTQVQPTAQKAVVAALLRLVQDKQVYLERMGAGQASAEMLASVPVINADPYHSQRILSRCLDILAVIPARRLHFLPDSSFWRVLEDIH